MLFWPASEASWTVTEWGVCPATVRLDFSTPALHQQARVDILKIGTGFGTTLDIEQGPDGSPWWAPPAGLRLRRVAPFFFSDHASPVWPRWKCWWFDGQTPIDSGDRRTVARTHAGDSACQGAGPRLIRCSAGEER
jgi:hypothetical protein